MRLGLRPTVFQPNTEWSIVRQLYGGDGTIWERHRHRYEVNPEYVYRIEKAGLTFTGRDEKGERMQVAEIRGSTFPPLIDHNFELNMIDADHPFYVGMQAHPEFCSRPLNPSPGYLGFVAAASTCLPEQLERQKDYMAPHPTRHLRYPSPAGSPRTTSPTEHQANGILTKGLKSLKINGDASH